MKNNKNRKSYAITGAAVLFVGLAGQVHAIPISTMNKNHNAAVNTAHKVAFARVVASGNTVMTRINPFVKFTAPVVAAKKPAPTKLPPKLAAALTPPVKSTFTPPVVSVITLSPPGSRALAATVPDSGTSLALLSGAFSTLILLKRKVTAKSGG